MGGYYIVYTYVCTYVYMYVCMYLVCIIDIFLTGPAKTGHICTNYTCLVNCAFLDQCLP